jgi:hypothetical protein
MADYKISKAGNERTFLRDMDNSFVLGYR